MTVQSLVRALGTPVQDASEETFELFAQDLPSQNLGFIDPRAPTLDLTIAGRDLTIHQSPGILSSNRAGGTTGAVVWKIAPLFAAWLASTTTTASDTTTTTKRVTTTSTKKIPTKNTPAKNSSNVNNRRDVNTTTNNDLPTVINPLFTHSLLTPTTTLLELGCGISALPALLLAPRIARYVLTDQPYVARLVELNLAENLPSSSSPTSPGTPSSGGAGGKNAAKGRGKVGKTAGKGGAATGSGGGGAGGGGGGGGGGAASKAVFVPLDWETDAVTPALTCTPGIASFDVVVACDCVYNEALIGPFVDTCAEVCLLRSVDDSTTATTAAATGSSDNTGDRREGKKEPCVCVVAQQLRDPSVFEAWLERFGSVFDVWRVPSGMVGRELGGEGFVVHVGVLKGEVEVEVTQGERV